LKEKYRRIDIVNENQSENSLTVEIDFIDGTSITVPRGVYEVKLKNNGYDAIKTRQEFQREHAPVYSNDMPSDG
jgi:hypothetical protein